MENIKQKVLSLNNGSYYDFNLHLAIPTVEFVLNETGEDIVLAIGSETKARAEIKKLTKIAWAILTSRKLINASNYIQYLIATDKEWRNQWLSFVCAVISESLEGKLYEILSEDKELPNTLKFYLESGLLSMSSFRYEKYEYLKGY